MHVLTAAEMRAVEIADRDDAFPFAGRRRIGAAEGIPGLVQRNRRVSGFAHYQPRRESRAALEEKNAKFAPLFHSINAFASRCCVMCTPRTYYVGETVGPGSPVQV